MHDLGAMRWKHPALAVLAVLLVLGGFINFADFMGSSRRLGGTASGGYVGDGYYFVGEKGRYRAVTREAWEWSQLQGRSIFVTHPLTMLAMAYLLFVWIFPLFVGSERRDTPQRVARVQESGPPIASTSCSAQLGSLSISGPLLNVSVHPGGIILKPIFMPGRGILATEIAAVENKDRLWAHRVSVRHTAPDVASMVILFIKEDSPVAQAIRSLIRSDVEES